MPPVAGDSHMPPHLAFPPARAHSVEENRHFREQGYRDLGPEAEMYIDRGAPAYERPPPQQQLRDLSPYEQYGGQYVEYGRGPQPFSGPPGPYKLYGPPDQDFVYGGHPNLR